MRTATDIADLLEGRIEGTVTLDAPLAPFTTFRVGGPADVLVEAESIDDLVAVAEVRDGTPIAIVGRGSNMLVADEGFRGIAIRLGRAFKDQKRTGESLRLGGAVHLPAAARLTARFGLTGFEFAAEIPGAFGGAVRMNAGAHDRSMADVLVSAQTVDIDDGTVSDIAVADLDYSYRHSSLGPSDVVTGGTIRLEEGDPKEVADRIASHLRWRREHQPGGRSAGSVFKNPPGDSAGRLIDTAGGKGLRIGGAEVSEVHANFIVTDPDAKASDVWALIDRLTTIVRDSAGVELEPEVRFIGTFEYGSSRT